MTMNMITSVINAHQKICEHCQVPINYDMTVICFSCSKSVHNVCKLSANFKCDEQNTHWYCSDCHDDEENLVNVTDINEDVLSIRNNLTVNVNLSLIHI